MGSLDQIRAKFTCTEIVDEGDTSQFIFRPVIEERPDFLKIHFAASRPNVAPFFKVGHEYRFIFMESPE